MNIRAKGNTPAQAIGTANVVARSYVAYASSGGNGVTEPVPAQMFLPATSASGTTLPWRLFYAAGTGVLVGALLGVIVALAIGRGQRWLRVRDDIADSIGVPVMASVRVVHPAKPAGWTKLLDTLPARGRRRVAAAQGAARARPRGPGPGRRFLGRRAVAG